MNSALFDARVTDAFSLCEKTSVPRFLGFLTPAEAARAIDILKPLTSRFEFFGGFDEAERRMLCCKPDWCDEPVYPIKAYTLRFRERDVISHRDVLGSLMSLGIVREAVGDILTEPGRAVVFLAEEISGYVVSQLSKVGGAGVTLSEGFELPLPGASERVECSDTVASLRLDCVIGAICGLSRRSACELIEQGFVSVNSVACEKATRSVSSGDRLTVRGKGRFDILSASDLSKKGRIILKYSKFI